STPILLSAANPVADFVGPTAATVGVPVTFTETAANTTSWLWFTDEAPFAPSTSQSFTYTFQTVGTHTLSLIASNANGSSLAKKPGSVAAPGARPLGWGEQPAVEPVPIFLLAPSGPDRAASDEVHVARGAFLHVTTAGAPGTEPATLFLRLWADGEVVVE